MLQVGIIGTGGMGNVHIKCWQKFDGAKIICACDIREEALRSSFPNADVVFYNNLDEMLENEKLDILDVCTPSYLHKEHALKGLKRNINVLCEKPACLSAEDAQELYDTAEKQQVKLMIAHVVRFWPEYRKLKQIYQDHTYGRLLNGHFWRIGSYPDWSWEDWMLAEAKSGLVPYDLHIHDLDFIVSVLGLPERVSAMRSQGPNDTKPDHLWASYHYQGCSIVTESAWYQGPYKFTAGYRVLFEKGVLEYSGGKLTLYEAGAKEPVELKVATFTDQLGVNLPGTSAYDNEIIYFADCVANDKPVSAVGKREISDVLNTIQKVVQAAKTGSFVSL